MSWKGDFEGALGKLKRLKGFHVNKSFVDDFKKELSDEKNRIDKRTIGGRDKDGALFTKYSKGYERYKANKGRNTKPNLEFSGQMLQAMDYKVDVYNGEAVGSIFIGGDQGAKARRHIEGDGVPVRNFLGFTKEFFRNLNRIIRKNING